ncbi:hypothetical protein ACMD2_24468, partial [Ananas comosus]
HATTHVWITVFSCFVKGFVTNPILSTNPVQLFTRKNPRSPAATLREGMIPTVRLSLCVMTQKSVPSIALTTNPLIVICSLHGGISSSSAAAAAAPGEGSSGSPISAAAEETSVPIWRSLRIRARVRVASGERRRRREKIGDDDGQNITSFVLDPDVYRMYTIWYIRVVIEYPELTNQSPGEPCLLLSAKHRLKLYLFRTAPDPLLDNHIAVVGCTAHLDSALVLFTPGDGTRTENVPQSPFTMMEFPGLRAPEPFMMMEGRSTVDLPLMWSIRPLRPRGPREHHPYKPRCFFGSTPPCAVPPPPPAGAPRAVPRPRSRSAAPAPSRPTPALAPVAALAPLRQRRSPPSSRRPRPCPCRPPRQRHSRSRFAPAPADPHAPRPRARRGLLATRHCSITAVRLMDGADRSKWLVWTADHVVRTRPHAPPSFAELAPPPLFHPLPGRSPPPQPSAAFTDGHKDPLPPPPPSATDENGQKSDERLHRLLWSRRFGPWGPPVVKSLDALPPSEIVYPPPPPTGAKNDQSGFQRFPWPPDEPWPPGKPLLPRQPPVHA